MPSENVREVQQARASSTTLAALTGKAGQLIVNKTDWRVHVMDGTTAGGHPVAMKSELEQKIADATSDVVRYSAQSLNASQKGQVRTNIGLGTAAVKAEGDFVSSTELTTALSDLITEFGGTVPAD